MTVFTVHVFREMRLTFDRVEADTAEEAALLCRDRPTDEAAAVDDCDGVTLAALVDVAGDDGYERSRWFDWPCPTCPPAPPATTACQPAESVACWPTDTKGDEP